MTTTQPRFLATFLLFYLLTFSLSSCTSPAEVTGEPKTWHRVTLSFEGPETDEQALPNPFTDYRLDVTFTNGDRKVVVPGFYAADGNAAETSADAGNVWQVHFMPDQEGEWLYETSFRVGENVAISDDPMAGAPTAFDGASGSFVVDPTDKNGRDFRAHGRLEYVGERYLRFAESGNYFLKGGADSPENLLAFADFDQTTSGREVGRSGEAPRALLHEYAPHAEDWEEGDPTWQDGKGKNLIGALNYLASEEVNSVYFLTMNVAGDGQDVWMWTSDRERFRFDVSKLAQWEIAFSHMIAKGIQLHVITQETENDQLLDGGDLGPERRLYYRELVARFAHHPAIVWNMGEENTNTEEQRRAFAAYIRDLDPNDHPIVVHNYPDQMEVVNAPLLGNPNVEGPSIQTNVEVEVIHERTEEWIRRSAEAGRPWFVCIDEPGSAGQGVTHDAAEDNNHDRMRKQALWGNLMAGGAGVEWYFGYQYPHNDLNLEDFRSRDRFWDYTRHAINFFQENLPFHEMASADELLFEGDGWVLAKPGEVYTVYLPDGGDAVLDLTGIEGDFDVRWFDPREGTFAEDVASVAAGGDVSLDALGEVGEDWVAVVKR